jgi:hypothetical protein
MLVLIIFNLFFKPIPQPMAYHHFADQRNLLGVPNGWNVLSNIPFAIAGIWGLCLLFAPKKLQFMDNLERWPWVGISIGLLLTAIGSSYYHLDPDNARLVWDRLPMTLVFMSFVTILINETISIRLGLWLWPILIGIGIYSVFQWQSSELANIGDLRLYISVQAFTIMVVMIMLFASSPYKRTTDLAVIIVFYGLAKLFELLDHQIYIFTNEFISGHTLKHFAAAIAGLWLIHMLSKQERI